MAAQSRRRLGCRISSTGSSTSREGGVMELLGILGTMAIVIGLMLAGWDFGG
jgi:hypothetical protein